MNRKQQQQHRSRRSTLVLSMLICIAVSVLAAWHNVLRLVVFEHMFCFDGEEGLAGASASSQKMTRYHQNRKLVFIHIPKTGGRAIEAVAQEQEGIEWGAIYWKDRQGWSIEGCDPKLPCARAKEAESWLRNQSTYLVPWHMPPCILDSVNQRVPTFVEPSFFLQENDKSEGDTSSTQNPTAEKMRKIQLQETTRGTQPVDLFTVVRNPYHRIVSEFWFVRLDEDRRTSDQMNDFIAKQLRIVEAGMRKMTHHGNNFNKTLSVFCNVSEVDPRYWVGDAHWVPQSHYVFAPINDRNVVSQRLGRILLPSRCGGFVQDQPPLSQNGQQQVIQHVLKYENVHEEFAALMALYGLNITLRAKGTWGPNTPLWEKIQYKRDKEMRRKLAVRNLSFENIQTINRLYRDDFVNFGYDMNDPGVKPVNWTLEEEEWKQMMQESPSAAQQIITPHVPKKKKRKKRPTTGTTERVYNKQPQQQQRPAAAAERKAKRPQR